MFSRAPCLLVPGEGVPAGGAGGERGRPASGPATANVVGFAGSSRSAPTARR